MVWTSKALAVTFMRYGLLIRLDHILARTLQLRARCQSRYDPTEGKAL